MQYRITLLGRFAVHRDGEEITRWPRAGAKRLLKLLAVSPQRTLSQERAATLLWPHEGGERVRQRLHHLVYLLRTTLDGDALDTADGLLRLRREGLSVDVEEFEARLQAALQPLPDPRAVEAALALHAGPLLPGDHDEPLLERRRVELEQRCATGLAAAAQAWRAAGEPARAAHCLQRLLALQPADEAAHCALIELHAELGRREAAERQYAACKAALADELGVVPSARTHRAYRAAMLGPGAAAVDDAEPGERHRPPAPPVALIGREALLEHLVAELAAPAARLLTLVGPGGIGKTLLALHAAQRLAPVLRHGACFVSLAEVDAAGVPERLRRALGLAAEPPDAAPVEVLAGALRDRQLLLVCDNAEHLGDALGLVGTLVESCPLLRVLVTSRRRVNLRVERVFEVPALEATPQAAMRLFEERARAVSPGFVLDAGNLADVEAIVRRVDGVPLAIELVAARTPLYPPAALRRALAVDFGLVAGGGPDRPVRHRSLDDSVAWSLALLPPGPLRLLHGCTLFAAPFDAGALGALHGPAAEDNPAAAVQALCEWRLLAREPGGSDAAPRWRLPEPVQLYLRRDAHAGAAAADAEPRFVAWFAGLAERLDAAGDTAGLDADHENFFVALEAADRRDDGGAVCTMVRALSRHWVRSGAWGRADAWVERAAARAVALPTASHVATLLAAGAYWHECQQIGRAHALAQEALRRAEAGGQTRLQARAALLFSSAAYHLGRPQEAIAPLRRIGELATALGDASLQRVAMNNLGNCHLSAGDLARARRVWRECDAGFVDEPPQERVATTFNLSLAAHYAGQHEEALRLSEQADTMECSAAPRAARRVLILVRRCWMWCCRGEAGPAAEALRLAREVAAGARLAVWERVCAAHEGKVALVAGRSERAAALLARGLQACASGADPWDLLDLRLWLLYARLAGPGPGDAVPGALADLVAMALPAWHHEHARILEAAAGCFVVLGRFEPAARALVQAETLRRRQGIRRFPFEQAAVRRTRAALRTRPAAPAIGADGGGPASGDDLAWLRKALA